ncbi:hypothetical protein SAMN05216201_10774 [Pseudomonas linyingensis]|uniref:Uncharacterized protein n=1 Tax=Pseudomonas linyingensis TaxID=915471 RepID=A0A1H6Y7U0_9PSED|nr:hypothetical protein [Pseudomonas linyingensis]SEJ33190.1 hypothetical protein SAMN05216201_10774 [Pseudomonas linyingensis]
MYYSEEAVSLAREFMRDDNGSYSKLAGHLNIFRSETDGSWTRDRAYHLCRINGIRSNLRCKAQPAAADTLRANTRQRITTALLEALSVSGKTIADIAPVNLKDVTRLSGVPLCTVRNNWHDLEAELNELAGL